MARRPVMPTTLPLRAAVPARSANVIEFVRTMIVIYVAIAIPIASILAIENDLGMFRGLTVVESIGLFYSDPQLLGMF